MSQKNSLFTLANKFPFATFKFAIRWANPRMDNSTLTRWDLSTTNPTAPQLHADSNHHDGCVGTHHFLQRRSPLYSPCGSEQKPMGSDQSAHHPAIYERPHVQPYQKGSVRIWWWERQYSILCRRILEPVWAGDADCGWDVCVSISLPSILWSPNER